MTKNFEKIVKNETPNSSTEQQVDNLRIFQPKKQNSSKSEVSELEPQLGKVIDLNAEFLEENKDLNKMFPEEEMRVLLKKINKNCKDIAQINQRFQTELELDEEKSIET